MSKNNFETGEDNDWSSEEELDEEQRIDFYRRVCHGDDDYDEEELKAWANGRFKHKNICKPTIVSLPSMSSTASNLKVEESSNTMSEEPKLKLPKGGWQVQRVELKEENNDLPTLLSSKLNLKPKKKMSGPRENAWKKMPNFFSDVGDFVSSTVPSAELFSKREEPNKESVAEPVQNDAEEEFKPAPSRSRERTENRKPRLLPCPKKDDKPRFLKNTKMCKNGEQCNRRAMCTFAHTLEEFNPITCRFQDRCNQKETCSFKHDFESKEDYIKRLSSF